MRHSDGNSLNDSGSMSHRTRLLRRPYMVGAIKDGNDYFDVFTIRHSILPGDH